MTLKLLNALSTKHFLTRVRDLALSSLLKIVTENEISHGKKVTVGMSLLHLRDNVLGLFCKVRYYISVRWTSACKA